MTGRIRNPWVVVAAYNEAPVVGSVVSGIRRAGYAVVVVDDGSSDRTGDLALLAGAVVVRHPVNLGQGAALQTGIDYALEQRADALVTFDADGQHSPVAIAALLAAIEQPGIDFALGSRFLTGATANLPVSRRHPAQRRALVHAREHRTAGHRYPQWPTGDDRARRPRDLLATEPNGARVRDPAPDRAEPPALCRGAGEHRVQCLFAGQGSTHHRCAGHPDRSV
jgi:glycosyltransferase involved in cell wall biosynthesis